VAIDLVANARLFSTVTLLFLMVHYF
jgi:hypothetical protein